MEPRPAPVRHPTPPPWRRILVRAVPAAVVMYVGLGIASVNWSASWPRPAQDAAELLFGWTESSTSCDPRGEDSAWSALFFLADAEQRFRAANVVDEDGDSEGEFGGLLELAGGAAPRGRSQSIVPMLQGCFRMLAADGTAARAGYRFRLHLLSRDGSPLRESPAAGFGDGRVDPDAAEAHFVCFAWPASRRDPAQRTFAVDESGVIRWTRTPYGGATEPAADALASDGDAWTPVR